MIIAYVIGLAFVVLRKSLTLCRMKHFWLTEQLWYSGLVTALTNSYTTAIRL